MLRLVPTPIGNIGDITFRSLEAFENAEMILCEDTRVTKRLLHLLSERYDFFTPPDARFVSFHEHNGYERLEEIGESLESIETVFVSDAGMPVISDPGRVLVEYCIENHIEYDILPGASASVTAYAASGFGRGKFLFLGFLQKKGSDRRRELRRAMESGNDLILYEAPHRLIDLLGEIEKIDPDREIFAAKEMTKRYQRYHRFRAGDFREYFPSDSVVRGEWVVVVEGIDTKSNGVDLTVILEADLPPKAKAKLLAKLTGESVSSWYEKIGGRGG
jgi:16S rRNA (cytidine1402-2'-O)-methyltransferase